ncbi:hypothetical protein EV144_103704 [Flavobacterium sp. 270]|uniref:hypothetical protein n=1 Tax=Flavobacterium sp. 270 TaxID=2512114 RepID=UPI001064FFFA|nr:hypothetical protein [Flavobacterium sp. 270]TDW49177.1 hypothetical protein EV144_103704 [Flavobacterium sp. 270]
MKRFISLTLKKFKINFFETTIPEGKKYIEKGKQSFLLHQFQDALLFFNNAIDSGFEDEVYELRACCLQKMNCHETAIEDFDKAIEYNPLKFSNYYSRALSKKAILDYAGLVEDINNAIYYYKKSLILDNVILKKFESELLNVKADLEKLTPNFHHINKRPLLEIRNLIGDSLRLIRKARFKNHNRTNLPIISIKKAV